MAKKQSAGAVADIEEYLLNYERPFLYPKQLDAIFDDRRYSFIEASTKAGKTSGCIVWITEQALHGQEGWNYWWVAPIYEQAKLAFNRICAKIKGNPNYTIYNSSPYTIVTPKGSKIVFRSGDDPDSLYGEDVYAVVIDEGSRMKEAAFHAILSTTTATNSSTSCARF